MAAALGGLEYESKVRSAVELASTKNKNIELLPDATAGFNANEVDLKVKIKGKLWNIEIKSSPDDQMGGTSLKYEIYPDRKSTRLNSSHSQQSRMPSSA